MVDINNMSLTSYFARRSKAITPDNGTCDISVVIIMAFLRTASSAVSNKIKELKAEIEALVGNVGLNRTSSHHKEHHMNGTVKHVHYRLIEKL